MRLWEVAAVYGGGCGGFPNRLGKVFPFPVGLITYLVCAVRLGLAGQEHCTFLRVNEFYQQAHFRVHSLLLTQSRLLAFVE